MPTNYVGVILGYGSYRHADSECTVARRTTRALNPQMFAVSVTRTWDIAGTLQATDSAALITAKNALERAYSQSYQDFVLLLSDGTTVFDSLTSSGSTTGVVVQGPDYPNGQGAEGGTFLSYSLSGSASFEFSATNGTSGPPGSQGGQQFIQDWMETVTETGGGPKWVVIPTVEGRPIRQLLNKRTAYRYTQSGMATGRYSFPTPPGPAWPDWEDASSRQVTRSGPVREGQGLTKYTTTWSYTFESPDPLTGNPNPWPL